MTYQTIIIIWSDIGNTPITQRGGSYCDELLYHEANCENPGEAKALAQKLLRETPHGYSAYYNMPDYPNQNTRNGYTR